MPACEADASQLGQVIMNLVINASEAMENQGGTIRIATGAKYCEPDYLKESYLSESLPAGRYVYLEVSDTGCGMSDDTRARLFDPFFSTKFVGRGLGLAAVLGIVRGHRGAIIGASELGKGSTFTVLLPASERPAVEPAAPKPVLGAWRGSGTVLVVDDEDGVRALAREIFEMLGFEVLTAANGRQGLEVFRAEAERIRLVLLDLTMPEMDGVETFREMRRAHADVRAILSSGYDEQQATARFDGRGLAGFLQKPYTLERFVVAVKQALERESAGEG
jgi:CheY-like chemotaxis protein